jgi:hypothetical protein
MNRELNHLSERNKTLIISRILTKSYNSLIKTINLIVFLLLLQQKVCTKYTSYDLATEHVNLSLLFIMSVFPSSGVPSICKVFL